MNTEIILDSDTELAREGYVVLSWEAANPDAGNLQLQQAATADFLRPTERAIAGSGAHTLTGLDDGVYYFRAGNAASGWSETLSVTVQHHSLSEALGFFSLGLLLFATLCAVIVRGARQTSAETYGQSNGHSNGHSNGEPR